eukprot:3560358-Prymnesium_polylepis.2
MNAYGNIPIKHSIHHDSILVTCSLQGRRSADTLILAAGAKDQPHVSNRNLDNADTFHRLPEITDLLTQFLDGDMLQHRVHNECASVALPLDVLAEQNYVHQLAHDAAKLRMSGTSEAV